ncbi:MAG TPA: CheR family methyltransferase [Acidimicrobiia bacterium]
MSDEASSPAFEALLSYLKASRGFDFTGYKRASLQRRVDRRAQTVGISDYEEYLDYLQVHPEEFVSLFNTILINVTGFFRDAPMWAYLQNEVLPKQLEQLPHDRPIRAWSAGCASGEEAYTLAMMLAELLGPDEFRRRVKVYGTDVDEEDLQAARQASYAARDVEPVPQPLREKYFDLVGDRYVFRNDLRRSIIFGRLDVLHDAPISRLELLACRNTLMYFNAETQAQVLERFHFALNEQGVLVLGKAETLLSNSRLFTPLDRKHRVFQKSPSLLGRSATTRIPMPDATGAAAATLETAALDSVPAAVVVVDRDGRVVRVNECARTQLGVARAEEGRPLQDLEVSYRPVELRAPINQAYEHGHPVRIPEVHYAYDGIDRCFDIEIVPLLVDGSYFGVSCMFVDVTKQHELQAQLRQTNSDLEQAYEEVQSTNEELETTNEELQSTIEELETTNEELQSTNEELETMNEELQSTNDELHAVNDEVRARGDEVDQLNQFLESILASLRGGVVVIDRDRRVRVWSQRAFDMWGLREEEVREVDLLDLDVGLPVADLREAIDECMAHDVEQENLVVEAVTRRGRTVECRVSISPLRERGVVNGAILVMDTR